MNPRRSGSVTRVIQRPSYSGNRKKKEEVDSSLRKL
jgi:hypothetical protein